MIGDQYTQLEWYSRCTSAFWPWNEQASAKIYVVTTAATVPQQYRGTPHILLDEPALRVTRWDP